MFLESSESYAPGDEIDFEFALEGGDALLRGRGEVAWVSEDDASGAGGLGVRFLDLDPGSEKLIERIEEIRTKSGREIFDIDRRARPEASTGAGDPTTDLLRAEIESLKESQLRDRARLVADLDTVRLERDRLAKRLHALEESDATGERDQLRNELEALQAEVQSARSESGLLEQRVREQDADLARFTEQGRHAMVERDRLENAKKTLAAELEAARAEVERLEVEGREMSESAGQLEEINVALAEAQASEETLREQLVEARSAAERLEEETRLADSQLRSELEELTAARAELQAGLEKGQAELDEVRRQFEESAGRNLELEHEATSMATQLAETRERLGELESEAAKSQEEIEELRARHESMESDLRAQRKVAKRAQKVSQRVRAEHVKLQEDLAEALATLEEAQERATLGEAAAEAAPGALDPAPTPEPGLDEAGPEVPPVSLEESPEQQPLEPQVPFEVAEEAVEAELSDSEVEVESWDEEASKKPKGSLWASITNKLMGEADPEEFEPGESVRMVVEAATDEHDPVLEAGTQEREQSTSDSSPD